MTDLTAEEMLARIKRGLAENSARFDPKIIVYEGMGGWGALRASLFEALERLSWRADGDDWYPPEGQTFDAAYVGLSAAVPPAPGMAREGTVKLRQCSEDWVQWAGCHATVAARHCAAASDRKMRSVDRETRWRRERRCYGRRRGRSENVAPKRVI